MKKTAISMLISALILFCAGLLLTLVTLIYTTASGTDIYSGQAGRTSNIRDFTKTFAELGFTAENPVKKIELSSLVGDVVILPTDGESRVEFYQSDLNNIVCKFENGTVTVKEDSSVGFMGIEISNDGMGFNGLRQLFRSSGNANSQRRTTLYLNPAEFKGVLNVKCEVGDVSAKEILCSELYVENTFGQVDVADCVLTSTLNVKGNFSDVIIRENTYLQSDINVTFGKIYALIDQQKTNLQTSVGDITVLTARGKDEYQLRLSNTSGAISPFDIDNNKNEFSLYSDSTNSIWAKSVFGKITVSEFDKERYPSVDFNHFSDLIEIS